MGSPKLQRKQVGTSNTCTVRCVRLLTCTAGSALEGAALTSHHKQTPSAFGSCKASDAPHVPTGRVAARPLAYTYTYLLVGAGGLKVYSWG